MADEMTDAERIALMRRINDRALAQIEREQTRPVWHYVAFGFGAVICGMVMMSGMILVAKHLL